MAILRWPARLWLLLAVGALLGCGLLGLFLWQAAGHELSLSAARNRWASRPFTHYQLVFENHHPWATCRYDVEVRDEQVVSAVVTPSHLCDHLPGATTATITGMFDRLSAADGQCGPNGCACDGQIEVEAIYDERLGYPHSARTHLRQADWWHSHDFDIRHYSLSDWRQYPRLTSKLTVGCTLKGYIPLEIRVLDLRPLP